MRSDSSMLPGLEEGLIPLYMTADPIAAPLSPETLFRLILAKAMEEYSVSVSHCFASSLSSISERQDLSLIRRVDLRQGEWLSAILSEQLNGIQGLLMVTAALLESAAAFAQALPCSPLRQYIDFTVPEYVDQIYRLANVLSFDGCDAANDLLHGRMEIIPGRPLAACHRHPYDGVAVTDKSKLEFTVPALILASGEMLFRKLTDAHVKRADTGSTAALCREMIHISEQHQTLFESALQFETGHEHALACHISEHYLYRSFHQTENDKGLNAWYGKERLHELMHIRKIRQMSQKLDVNDEELSLPLFIFTPGKGYIRDVLRRPGLTLLRDRIVSVGDLMPGADFFRFQRLACAPADRLASHRIVQQMMDEHGSDYRYEIARHPVPALRSRTADPLDVGRMEDEV